MSSSRRLVRPLAIAVMSALVAVCPTVVNAQQASTVNEDWAALDQALGRTGAVQPGGVHRYSFPRNDLQVTVSGVQLRPAFALGSWVAFREAGQGQVMAMGDLVLSEDEVTPVMRALQRGGIEQTALHNHVLHESPRVMYMHIAAHGDATKLATALRAALSESRTPLGAPSAAAPSAALDLDTVAIARELGVAGKVNGGVYQVSVPRRETIREHGLEIPPSMGVATAINFQPTGNGRAAITGDFVMRGSEVNAVIRALQQGGVEVTALHSHMIDEEPRLYFMHFWANDDASSLARTLRRALDQMAVKLAAP